jgi:transcriptional regulator with XRE-family HTH domain
VASGIINLIHVSQKFEHLLDAYRRPDGSRWTGQQLDEATDGGVSRSYVTNLSKGRIKSPGHDKMAAIAKAMGFPQRRGSRRTRARSRNWTGGLRVR